MEYFEQSEQFVLSNKDDQNNYKIILMNKDYEIIENEKDEINFQLPAGRLYRDSIIYLKNEKCYAII